ncbi:hypothetical protein ElyMa_006161500 [Elysia marginata]|uniref:Uncharacterized protein n=1 Tax=Elysia marginata TaxID=1093978 RepID=A0AAV4H101_9GAST|nr:hypothetical protein ElyMa_006161500 [Elysia marginata]
MPRKVSPRKFTIYLAGHSRKNKSYFGLNARLASAADSQTLLDLFNLIKLLRLLDVLTGKSGSGRGGSSTGHGYHQTARPAGTLTPRQARTSGFVDTDRDSGDSTASQHSLSRSSKNYYSNRDSRDSLARISTSSSRSSQNSNIPRCRNGQTITYCLSRVLMQVEEMLELEQDKRDRRAQFDDSYYNYKLH